MGDSDAGVAVTHDELCREVAKWCLRQAWCHAAATDCSLPGIYGRPDVVAVSTPLCAPVNPLHDLQAAAEAKQRAAKREAALLGRREEQRAIRRAPTPGAKKALRAAQNRAWRTAGRGGPYTVPPVYAVARPRVVVIEVKRTRSDLLGDLRAGKMLHYQNGPASHWYLCGTAEALGEGGLGDLAERGLPLRWGVLSADRYGVQTIRACRQPPATVGQVAVSAAAVLQSLAHRAVR